MSPVEKIDTGSFDETIASIKSNRESYAATRESLVRLINDLSEGWNSPSASQAFYDAMSTASTRLLDVEGNLETLEEDLKTIKQSYEEWDNATYIAQK